MRAQNTHDIPAFYHVFVSFHIVISVVIALYLILGFLCTLGEKCGIWKLYGDLKKENGEPSSNVPTSQRPHVATLRSDDVLVFNSPMSRCCRDLINKILRYKAKAMSF